MHVGLGARCTQPSSCFGVRTMELLLQVFVHGACSFARADLEACRIGMSCAPAGAGCCLGFPRADRHSRTAKRDRRKRNFFMHRVACACGRAHGAEIRYVLRRSSRSVLFLYGHGVVLHFCRCWMVFALAVHRGARCLALVRCAALHRRCNSWEPLQGRASAWRCSIASNAGGGRPTEGAQCVPGAFTLSSALVRTCVKLHFSFDALPVVNRKRTHSLVN
jgi:hypothetical protein